MTSGVGQAVKVAAVVAVTDPHGFTGAEAGGGREAHWLVAVESIVSEGEGRVNTIHEAVTGSSTTVGSILRGSTLSVGILIPDPLATQRVDRVERPHATSTDGNVPSGNV